jgi:hypothetical protein
MHSNRLPGWRELKADERAKWCANDQQCPECGGDGRAFFGGAEAINCSACQGTGRKPASKSQQKRFASLGKPASDFDKLALEYAEFRKAAGIEISFMDAESAAKDARYARLLSIAESADETIRDYYNKLAATQAELAACREALRKYGDHMVSCPKGSNIFPLMEGVGYVCTCGFEAALSPPAADAADGVKS